MSADNVVITMRTCEKEEPSGVDNSKSNSKLDDEHENKDEQQYLDLIKHILKTGR